MVFDPNPLADLNIHSLKNLNVYLTTITEDNNYAFISAREGGVLVISLKDKLHSQIINIIPALQAQYLQVLNGILYIGDVLDGLVIYNVKNIEKPELLSKWQIYKHIQSIVVTKDSQYGYALGNGIVFLLNLSDLTKPDMISRNGVIAPDSYRVKLSPDETHICVSNHIKGVQIIDTRYKQQIIIRANNNPSFVTWDCIFTPDQSSIYVVDAYYGLFYAYVKPIFEMPVGSTDLFTLNFKSIYNTPQVSQSVALTSDGFFLLLGLRSVGLKLFEIKDGKYDEPVFVQNLEGEYLTNDVQFSHNNDEAYAFVTNGMSLLIYQQVQLDTNKDFPNIFNTFQSSLTYTSPEYWPWQIICLQDNKHVIQSNPATYVNIFNIEDRFYPSIKAVIPQQNGHLGGLQVDKEQKVLFIGATQHGLEIYDIQKISDPQYKTNYTPLDPTQFMNQGVGVTIDRNGEIVVLANGFYGIGIIDVTSPFQPKEIGKFINDSFPCGFEKCEITSDQTTIICACREIGLFFFDFTNKKLQMVYLLQKLGAEYLILSQDEKYAFVCNGFQGIVIVNIQNKMQPFVVSDQPLDGWAQSLVSIFDEKYLIASQIEKGQLVVVNIEDLQNPYIQSKLYFPNESSNSICVTPDKKSAYFIGNKGMRFIPIQTDLTVHTQIQVQNTDMQGMIYYKNLRKEENLLVGQIAQVFFVPLYIQAQVKFENAFYYRNFEKQVLPYWITFYESKKMLQILVDKLGAQNNFSKERNGENIIILECLVSLSKSDFNTPNINSTLANQIYKNLINQGYIDSEGFLTSKLDSTIYFYLDFFDDNQFQKANVGTSDQIELIQQDIKKILVFSRTEYPIRFFIKSSLIFNYNRTQTPDLDIIQSPSLQISLLLQINKNGKFVKKAFDGVLTSFSDDQTSVKIQGQTYYVNKILQERIQIANKTSNLTDIMIDFIISDQSNYDIQQTIPLSDLPFISLHSPIEVFQLNNLQIQFDKYFTGSNLNVEQRFQFSFDMNTFRQKNNLQMTYKAYLVESETELKEISTGDWIEFNDFNLGFSGQRSIDYMFTTYRVRVVASDGYSSAYDEFFMDFNRIPFFYVIQLIIQIVGPILGVFGIWKYRAEIYMFLMERFYLYSNESAVVGEVYKKKIVLMNEIWDDSVKLWKLFLVKNKNFDGEVIQEYTMNQKIDITVVMARLYLIYSENQKKFSLIDPREFEFLDSRLVRIIKRFCYQIVLNKDKNTQKALGQLKKVGCRTHSRKDWYKQFINIAYQFEVQKNKVVQQIPSQLKTTTITQNPEKKNQIPANIILFDNNSMDSKRDSFHHIDKEDNQNDKQFTDRQLIKTEQKTDHIDSQFNRDAKSSLFQPIELDSYAAKDMPVLISNRQSQNQLFNIDSNSNTPGLPPKDHIIQQKEEEMHNLNPFPEITVKMELILSTISTQKPHLKWDKKLLQEILILEASGISNSSPNRISPATGESLHLFSHQLLRVEAFKRDQEDSCCLCLKKFFKANYSPIGLNQNNPLPQWLNCQIIDGIIHMWGTPKSNDEPEILIRVIDQLTFTIFSFHIFIKDKEGHDLRDKSNITMNKIKSENNLVASMRKLKQQQNPNSPSSQIQDAEAETQIKTLSNIPKLSKFCKDIMKNQQSKRRVMSQQLIPVSILPVQEQPLQKEQDSPTKKKKLVSSGIELDSPTKVSKQKNNNSNQVNIIQPPKLTNFQSTIKETSIEIEISPNNRQDEGEDQSANFDEKQENENYHRVTITDYIKNQN